MNRQKNIGQLIEDEVRKQQISIVEFAKKICCQRSNVYDIFKRNKMDIMQLKQISIVLNRNFFKELASDLDLINECEDSIEEINKQKAISQFFSIVPDILIKLGKPSIISFCKLPDYVDYPTPDYASTPNYITFTIAETLKDRIGICSTLPIDTIFNNDNSCMVEVCTNTIVGSIFINIVLDYKTEEEWYKILAFAFETYDVYIKSKKI